MTQHMILLALRALAKNGLYAALCVLSLFLGLVVFISSLAYVERVRTLDEGLTNYDQLYEFHSLWPALGQQVSFGTTPRTKEILHNRFPEIQQITRLINLREMLVASRDQQQYVQFMAADPNFFEIIDYPFAEGDPASALDNPNTVVLSRSAATEYFGDGPVLGETIEVEGQFTFEVTGIVEDLPVTSGLLPLLENLDFVSSIETFRGTGLPQTRFQEWGANRAMTIAVVPPELSRQDISAGLQDLVADYWPEMYHDSLEIRFRHFGDLLSDLSMFGGVPLPNVILGLGIAVLLVGCANFASLLTAQNTGRIREMALRKALGSSRHLIVMQFLLEGLLISLAALGLALCALPHLFGLVNQSGPPWWDLAVLFKSQGLMWLALLVPAVTLIGAAYPAFRFSAVHPNRAFRAGSGIASSNSASRGATVVVQFTLALILLIAAIVVWQQQAHIEALNARYAQDQIVVIDRIGREKIQARLPLFKQQLLNTDGIVAVAASNSVPGKGRFFTMKFRKANSDPETGYWLTAAMTDPDFISVYDIELIAGRHLSEEMASDLANPVEAKDETFRLNVLINENAVSYLGYASPEDAIGQILVPTNEGYYPYVIAGVVENANIRPYPFQRESTLFFGLEAAFANVSVRISGDNVQATIGRLEDAWESVYPEFPMEWKFLDEEFAAVYASINSANNILLLCCSLALVISSLGMFGLAGYIAENRTKEIEVRKVMGATVSRIMRLLIWDFSKPVILANLIAWPIAYLAMRSYLDGFAERIDLSPLFFVGSGALALGVAWLVVAAHVWRAAQAHPAQALRYE